MMRPAVSVVICVYNGASIVGRALDSVFAQNFDGVEVVVVDDGSTDRTAEVLDRYGDRIRVIRQDNQGLALARNAGVAASRSEFVAFLDADDLWMPGRLAKTVAALEHEPGAVLAFSDAVPVDSLDQPLGPSFVPSDKARAPSMDEIIATWWPILPSTVTMRRQTFIACGGFCDEYRSASGFEDVYLFILAREMGSFVYVPEPLTRYRLAPFVDRMIKYAPGFELFSRHLCERYGEAGSRAIQQRAQQHSRSLVESGMQALDAGRMKQARRAFLCARRYERLDRRSLLRLVRTYLPAPIAIALSSRKRRVRTGDADRLNSG
ncbi:MAG: glycosyltransferase family 2 protein [Candidatus Binatales bacterium]